MIEVYKYLNNKYTVDTSLLSRIPSSSTTRGHPLKLEKICKSRQRENCFTMRAVNPWNSLPSDVVLAPTVNAFKNRLNKHWKHV